MALEAQNANCPFRCRFRPGARTKDRCGDRWQSVTRTGSSWSRPAVDARTQLGIGDRYKRKIHFEQLMENGAIGRQCGPPPTNA